MQNKIIFNAQKSTTERSPLKSLIYKIVAVISVVIFVYLVNNISFADHIVFYLVLFVIGILAIQFFIISTVKNYAKIITYIEMDDYSLEIKYLKNRAEVSTQLAISTTDIQLFELKDYRSFFTGLKIEIVNLPNVDISKKQKFKITNDIWSYEEFEAIYTEFKKRKNESIPEDEMQAFKQLQIMNGTDS